MGTEEKNRNESLSRTAADLFANSKGGEELSSRVQRLREEIRKVIESEDTIFGKFRGLEASFTEIIPDEKQRYNAALKALSTTSKLSRHEIVKAVNNQLEELKILEKVLMPANAGWRGELKAMEARAQEMKDEIAKLREKIALLENEERGIFSGMAAREKEMELVEKAVGELFTEIGAEITSIRKKVEDFTAESAVSQPIPPKEPVTSDIPSEAKTVVEQKSDILEASPPLDTEWQKKCPMCGGQMSRLIQINEEIWQCYSCAYEELKKDDVQDTSEEESEFTRAAEPAPASKPAGDPSPPFVVPLASMISKEEPEPKKGASPVYGQASSKKKTCPVCRKKMTWYYKTKTWRCPFCQHVGSA